MTTAYATAAYLRSLGRELRNEYRLLIQRACDQIVRRPARRK